MADQNKASTSKLACVFDPVPLVPDPAGVTMVPDPEPRQVSPPLAQRFNHPSPNLPPSDKVVLVPLFQVCYL